jgi:hypothetical protein
LTTHVLVSLAGRLSVRALNRAAITNLGLSLLAAVGLLAAESKQTFTGTITDDVCARADHSQMRMGPTDAECAAACIEAHGAVYVLFDGESAYTLSDQRAAEKFAAKKVRVVGTLDGKAKAIHVESITAAK